jgi:hypothetical protein
MRWEQGQHLILLDQMPGEFERFSRIRAIIDADEIDVSAVDAAALVDHLEIAGFGTRHYPVLL